MASGIYLNPTFSGSGDSSTISTGTRIAQSTRAGSASVNTTLNPNTIYALTAGDTLAVSAFQGSGGGLNTVTDDFPVFNVAWIGLSTLP
jgi:hypothetical protein